MTTEQEAWQHYFEEFSAELFAMVLNYPELEGWRAAVEASWLRPMFRALKHQESRHEVLLKALREIRERTKIDPTNSNGLLLAHDVSAMATAVINQIEAQP